MHGTEINTHRLDVERKRLVSAARLVRARNGGGSQWVQVVLDQRLSRRVGRGRVSNGCAAVTKDGLVKTMIESLRKRVGAGRVGEGTDPCGRR